jgi:PAS domain S-box-containing protein
LSEHPVITLGHDPSWPPIEFSDERGEISGMSGDYVKLVEQRLGVTFTRVPNLSWQEVYARQRRREIDVATCVARTPQREDFWVFTKPYLTVPIVIAAQPDVTYIAGMQELSGKKIALVAGYAIDDWITRDFPDFDLARVKDPSEGLALLQRGEVFAYIDNLLIIGDYQAKLKVNNIKIVGQTPYVNAQRMAVRKDWAPLAVMLDRALDTISEAERRQIHDKWLPLRYAQGFDSALLWRVLILSAAVFGALIFWNRKLSREIANRRQVEEALRESEGRHQAIIRAIPDLIFTNRADGEFVAVEASDTSALFVPPEDFLQRKVQDVLPEAVAGRFLDAYRQALATGRLQELDYRLPVGGRERRFEARVVPASEERLITIVRDITERKRTEEALLASQRRYAAIIAATREGVFDWDMNGSESQVSDRWCAIYGLPPATPPSMEVWRSTVLPEDLAMVDQSLQDYLAGKTPISECEYRIRTAGGEERWVRGRAVALRDASGVPFRVFGTVADITERKRSEEAVRKEKDFIQAVLDSLPGLFYLFDAQGRLLRWNRSIETTSGYSADEVAGMPLLDLFVAADRPRLAEGIGQVIQSGEGLVEGRILSRDGTTVTPFLMTGKRFLIDGRACVVGMGIDITELKRTQEALHASLREKETLLKEVHHRVKNNLQIVSSLLRLQARQVESEQLRSFLRDTQNRIRSMSMLHEILYRSSDFSTIGFRQYLRNLCQELVRSCGAAAKNIRLEQSVMEVELDMDQAITTGLIVNELVTNAIKHAFPTGTPGTISVALRAEEGQLALKVADDGVGLPATVELENQRTLGLLLVQNLCRQLDGRLTLQRTPGTAVEIVFPRRGPAAPEGSARPAP